MDPILHNFDPYLIRFDGGGGIRVYSIPYILGILFSYARLEWAVKRKEIAGLTSDHVGPLILYSVIGAVVGARFFHVFVFEYSNYGFDPMRWIAFWRGGMAFHGGLTGAVVAMYLYLRRLDIPLYSVLDRLVFPVAAALGFGRVANFINAEMYGTLYDGPFCVDYTQNQYMNNPPEGCRHPVQLYEMTKNWSIAAFLYIQTKKFNPAPGVPLWSFIGLYGLVRFMLMYYRVEPQVAFGLTLSQIFSGLMAVLGGAMVVYCMRRAKS